MAAISVSEGSTNMCIRGPGKYKYCRTDYQTEHDRGKNGAAEAGGYPIFFSGSVILRHVGGKGIPKILYGQVGKGINLYGRRNSEIARRARSC